MAKVGVDYLLTISPDNIRMLTGYWPVTGTSALLFGAAKSVLVIPKDEERLAESAAVDEIRPYIAGTLSGLEAPPERIVGELRSLGQTFKPGVIGIDADEKSVPATYVARWLIRIAPETIECCFPGSQVLDCAKLYSNQRSILTNSDLETLRKAVHSARVGFDNVFNLLESTAGISEVDLASRLSVFLSAPSQDRARAGGQFFCMSGPNSARASAAFQESGNRQISSGEVLLVHCNSYIDGLWTDITRTYFTGPKTPRFQDLFDALLQARDAALAEIRPGAPARIIDTAARDSLKRQDLAAFFTHGLGHGVGFSAINHLAPPVIHPQSNDILEAGMVFNVEPAVYFPGEFGIRHCDMAVITQNGVELLTPFS
jgi:Xaa-Pro dipeptidase